MMKATGLSVLQHLVQTFACIVLALEPSNFVVTAFLSRLSEVGGLQTKYQLIRQLSGFEPSRRSPCGDDLSNCICVSTQLQCQHCLPLTVMALVACNRSSQRQVASWNLENPRTLMEAGVVLIFLPMDAVSTRAGPRARTRVSLVHETNVRRLFATAIRPLSLRTASTLRSFSEALLNVAVRKAAGSEPCA